MQEQTATFLAQKFFFGQNEFSVLVRHWPPVLSYAKNDRVRSVRDALWDMETGILVSRGQSVLSRYRVSVPQNTSLSEAKLEVVAKLEALGYMWLAAPRLFDRIKGKVFCIVN